MFHPLIQIMIFQNKNSPGLQQQARFFRPDISYVTEYAPQMLSAAGAVSLSLQQLLPPV